jgi:lipopolysaccharide transport system permease protein
MLATVGVAWMLSSLGVFVRDIGQITGILTTVLLFLSPVFYPVSALPREYQFWLRLNPLTFIIEEARSVLIFGDVPDLIGLLAVLAVSMAIDAMVDDRLGRRVADHNAGIP